jgi:hypothetical protein
MKRWAASLTLRGSPLSLKGATGRLRATPMKQRAAGEAHVSDAVSRAIVTTRRRECTP